MDIRNMPAEAANYEFVVVIPEGDHYTFLGMYTDGNVAADTALGLNGIVIHHVRIQGYQPPERKKKCYVFSGVWSWSCWAINEEEARKQFDDDWDCVDLDLDHIEIEVDE